MTVSRLEASQARPTASTIATAIYARLIAILNTITTGGRPTKGLTTDTTFTIIGTSTGEVHGARDTITTAISVCLCAVSHTVIASRLGTDGFDTHAAVAIRHIATLEARYTGCAGTTAVNIRLVAISNAVFAGGCCANLVCTDTAFTVSSLYTG